MAFCGNCGAQHGETEKFCGVCGYPIKKKKSKKPLIIGGATGAVVIVLVVAIVFTNGFGLFGRGSDVNPFNPTGGNINPTDGNNNPASTNGSNNPGDIDLENLDDYVLTDPFWLNYDWDNFDITDVFEPLGDATFTVDSANRITGEFTPGEAFTLSLTDSAGMKWTLNIPDDALLNPTIITMTALRDVRINGGDPFNGVLMEPDGLFFLNPATLTMSGGNYSEDYAIFQSNHDGTGVTPLYFENDISGATANLYHFSTYVVGWPSPPSKKANQALVAALHMCKTQLVMPVPPSMSFKCKPNHAKDPNEEAALDKFLKEFKEPEWTLYQWILAQCRGINFGKDASQYITKMTNIGKDSDGNPIMMPLIVPNPNAFTLDEICYIQAMSMMIERIDGKVIQYFGRYKYQEDKFKAIGHASRWMGDAEKAIGMARLRMMIQENEAKIEWVRFEPERRDWTREVWNQLMKELVEKHDYTLVHALEEVYLFAKFMKVSDEGYLGLSEYSQPMGIDQWQEKLANALTFRVEWELEEHVFFTICSKGEAEVSMKYDMTDYFGEGDGEGHLDSFTDPDGNVYVTAFPFFDNKAQLSKLDPCFDKTITVAINKFGTDFTAYADTDMGPMPIPFTDYPKPIIHYVDGNAVLTTGFFTFKLDLINLSEKCAESSITAQEDVLSHTLDFKIFHQPKDDVYMK